MNDTILKKIKFDADGLIPAVIQEYQTGQVLMVAYMNEASLGQTLETGETVFWSRSRKALWKKGETSGNIQTVKEILLDCDEDTLLIKVDQKNGACHTGHFSCFYRSWAEGELKEKEEDQSAGQNDFPDILNKISRVIAQRKQNPSPNSYVSSLFSKGQDAILKKIAEESGEVILSSKNRTMAEIIWEIADLWFHTLVLLGYHGISVDEIYRELEKREGKPGLKK
ncbi:MAG: bifunctional phosphoribosyl-AMP cyclohydrolase/phosphoribosyl-ATP diphosphatase HisIE [Nitrospirae bacterium]|nr:bifunctional phosphoribosyl-AMP cyclohydrolase/phosphoribosyl-ATP diphosphatase HisIE [Nitrospirota bacterium]